MKTRLIFEFPSLVFEGGSGASDVEISNTESILNVNFPVDYSEYLKDFGWLTVGHYEFFGIGINIPNFLNLTIVAPDEWRNFELPNHLLPIWNNGGGDLSCINLLLSGKHKAVIYDFYHDNRQEKFIATGFENWLKGMLLSLVEDNIDEG